MKPKTDAGGSRPPRLKVPPREVAVGPPPKPQKKVKSKKGSFPAPRPEVTRPVTPKQKKAIAKNVSDAKLNVRLKNSSFGVKGQPRIGKQKSAATKIATKFKTTSGDPLTGLNRGFTVASQVADLGLKKVGAPQIVRNGVREIVDSPAQVVPSTVETVKHPKAAANALADTFRHPIKSFEEHPVTTALILRGGVSGIGRGAGAAMRSGALGSAAKKAASTERADLKTPVGPAQQRYSKDVIDKSVQKGLEKSKTVTKVRVNKAANRKVDMTIGANETIRRVERTRAGSVVQKAKPKHEDAVPLVNEGVLKHPSTVQADLQGELQRLQTAKPRDAYEKRQNAENAGKVQNLLADQKFLADPAPAFAAARTFAKSQKPVTMQRVHFGDVEAGAAARRPLLPFAVRELGLKWDEEAKAFRNASGTTVPNRTIIAKFKQQGGDPKNLAYVPEKRSFKGARNFYVNTSKRPFPESGVYKGKNTEGGFYSRDFDTLVEQAVRGQGHVSAHQGIDRLINEFGRTKPGGSYFTGKDAVMQAENLNAATGENWVALRVLRGQSKEAGARIKAGLAPQEFPQMFSDHVSESDGNVVLFPEAVAKRIMAHENASKNVFARDFQAINQRFRHVVLPTSPRWFVGNVVEMLARTAIEDPTFFKSVMTGVNIEKVVKELGGQEAVDRLRAYTGEGNFGAQAQYDIHRPPEHEIARAVQAVRHAPGPKEVVDAWDLYKKLVFGANGRAESLIYYAGLGKEAAREVESFTGAWHKTLNLGGPAYRDVARGLLETPNIVRYAKAVDDMRGRYTNLSPRFRAYTITATPFAPWYVNALHFVFYTLPVKHPILTGVLGASVQSQQQNLQALGLTHFAGAQKPVPGFLQGSLPTKKGLMRFPYTPFAAFSDPGDTAAGLVLPQASFAANLSGLNYKGDRLKDANGNEVTYPGTVPIALNTLAESFIPFLRHARQIREKGGTSVDTSTVIKPQVKKGTKVNTAEGVKRTFYPFYVSGNKPKGGSAWGTAAGTSGGGTGGWGAASGGSGSGTGGWGAASNP